MKPTLMYLVLISVIYLQSCTSDMNSESASDCVPKEYFANSPGLQSGGVQMIPVNTEKGTFNVWTKRIGNNPKIKVLLLHGGPGATHAYFECFESFLPAEGIEFFYYDQLGSGNSDNPSNPDDTVLWNLPRFVEEVETVRKALGLNSDNFYLLGSSWGGLLAMEYALKYQQNLKGLIISNMMASAPDYGKYADSVLAKQIDPAVLAEIQAIEKAGDFDNPRYMELLMPNFYEKHVLRMPADEWPEPVVRSLNNINPVIYVSMQGPSEFGVSGKLEKWDIKERLHEITVPTLVIGATHDTMDPKHMEWISTEVKNGEFLLCPNGSHFCMWDDQEIYLQGLISFLKK